MVNKKLSIIIPVFNEERTILDLIEKVKLVNIDKEIIIVDDGSSDRTREILLAIKQPEIKILFHEKNQGKGVAIRTAIGAVSGEVVVIQDGDLEYDPQDFISLLNEFEAGKNDAVYGSRFLKNNYPKGMDFAHWLANKIYSNLASWLYGQKITDIATCYKMINAEILKKINLESRRFEFCPEITAKIIRSGIKIKEVSINYEARNRGEGKKIGISDALSYLWAIIKYRFK